MNKKILLFLTLLDFSFAYPIELDLIGYATLVSEEQKINILVSPDINASMYTFIIADDKKGNMFPAFKQMLSYQKLHFYNADTFYYIDKEKNEKVNLYTLKLNNLVYSDVANLLSLYDIKSTYSKDSHSVSFLAKRDIYRKILLSINKIDFSSKQVTFKINVLETSLQKIKDRGVNLSTYAQSVQTEKKEDINLNYFLNLITMPYTATTNVLNNSKKGFYAVLKFLNQNDYTHIKTSPFLTAKSNKKVSFSSVTNIPYLSQTTEQKKDTTTTTSTYDYKDVGLKLNILPTVVNDTVHFSLSLDIEDIIDTSLTPRISKKTLSSTYSLKRGDLLILSGINKDTQIENDFGIPILKDIYLLGHLFKFKSKKNYSTTLTITIEVL